MEDKKPLSVSEVRRNFAFFFERVRDLYNLSLGKNASSIKVEDIVKYGDELLEADRISEYLNNEIHETVEKFKLLLIGNIKKMDPIDVRALLQKLDDFIRLALDDVHGEITDIIAQ